eukprot:3101614-Amphidinium_carterae.1
MDALSQMSHGFDGRNLHTRSFTFGGSWAPSYVSDQAAHLESDCPRNRQKRNQRLPSEEWCTRKHHFALDHTFVSPDMKTSCSVWTVPGLP